MVRKNSCEQFSLENNESWIQIKVAGGQRLIRNRTLLSPSGCYRRHYAGSLVGEFVAETSASYSSERPSTQQSQGQHSILKNCISSERRRPQSSLSAHENGRRRSSVLSRPHSSIASIRPWRPKSSPPQMSYDMTRGHSLDLPDQHLDQVADDDDSKNRLTKVLDDEKSEINFQAKDRRLSQQMSTEAGPRLWCEPPVHDRGERKIRQRKNAIVNMPEEVQHERDRENPVRTVKDLIKLIRGSHHRNKVAQKLTAFDSQKSPEKYQIHLSGKKGASDHEAFYQTPDNFLFISQLLQLVSAEQFKPTQINAEKWIEDIKSLVEKKSTLREIELAIVRAEDDIFTTTFEIASLESELNSAAKQEQQSGKWKGAMARVRLQKQKEHKLEVESELTELRKMLISNAIRKEEVDKVKPDMMNDVGGDIWAQMEQQIQSMKYAEKDVYDYFITKHARELLELEKRNQGWWQEQLNQQTQKPHNIKVDEYNSRPENSAEEFLMERFATIHKKPGSMQVPETLSLAKPGASFHKAETDPFWNRSASDDQQRFFELADYFQNSVNLIGNNDVKFLIDSMQANRSASDRIVSGDNVKTNMDVKAKLMQIRFRDISKAFKKWFFVVSEIKRSKQQVLNAYEEMCRRQNSPATGITVFSKLIFAGYENDTDLVDLTGINWGPKGARALASVMTGFGFHGEELEFPSLMKIRRYTERPEFRSMLCGGCRLGNDGAEALCQMIVTCKIPLKLLDLSSNELSESASFVISSYLCDASCVLESLILDGNALGDSGVANIADAVLTSSSLQFLSLQRNRADNTAGTALGGVLRWNKVLVELNLAWNDLHAEGAAAFAEGLVLNSTLRSLNLSRNAFGSPKASNALARAVKSCALELLDLSDNHLADRSILPIAESLIENKELKVLLLDGNPIQLPGARQLLRCAGYGNSHGMIERVISMKNCSVQIIAPLLSNPDEPGGFYALDLREEYSHAVMRRLIAMNLTGDCCFDKESGTLTIKENGKAHKQQFLLEFQGTDSSWTLPDNGILEFRMIEKRKTAIEKAELTKEVVELLKETTKSRALRKARLYVKNVAAVAMLQKDIQEDHVNVTNFQELERILISSTFDPEARMRIALAYWNRLPEQSLMFALLRKQEQAMIGKASAMAASLNNFSSGHYILDLAVPAMQHLALRLQNLRSSLSTIEERLFELLQSKSMTDEECDQINLIWKNLSLNNNPVQYSEIKLLPSSGILEFDFVDIRHPPPQQPAMSDDDFESLVLNKWKSKSKLLEIPLLQTAQMLDLLRAFSAEKYFTCSQIIQMLQQFDPCQHADSRVEILVICWSRTVDWHGLRNILNILTPFEYKVLKHRLGPIQIFDELMAAGFYELDLSKVDEHFLMRWLLNLKNQESGSNIENLTLDGIEIALPKSWHNSLPNQGFVTLCFVRQAEVILSARELAARPKSFREKKVESISSFCEDWMKPYCPNGCTSPGGRKWIEPYIKRRLRLKLAQNWSNPEDCFSSLQPNSNSNTKQLTVATFVEGLAVQGVWLHLWEAKKLLTVLDPAESGIIRSADLAAFWEASS